MQSVEVLAPRDFVGSTSACGSRKRNMQLGSVQLRYAESIAQTSVMMVAMTMTMTMTTDKLGAYMNQ